MHHREPHAPAEYVFIFVRYDLPLPQQLVQTNHATMKMASLYGIEGTPNIALIGVSDIVELRNVSRLLSDLEVPHHDWYEPDFDLGFTAIATAPISGAQRTALSHYDTWKRSRAVSSIGRAADSKSAGSGFEPLMALHS